MPNPNWNVLLAQWWGAGGGDWCGGDWCGGWWAGAAASNVIIGGNPPYQVSDFLAMYPKFGTGIQALAAIAISAGLETVAVESASPGTGYVVGDQLTLVQSNASQGVVQVTSVGAGGAVATVTVIQGGIGYTVAAGIGSTGGTGTGAIFSITAVTPLGGSGYEVGDVVNLIQPDASGGTLGVSAVDGSGAATALTIETPGTGYSIASGLLTTGGHGANLQVSVTTISPYSGVVPLPVLQLYINLAAACLAKARWMEMWPLGMALFVAHYLTLYLRTEGNAGSTAGQIAVSGLAKGLTVSQSAGDVSQSREFFHDLDSWAGWQTTEYGIQFATIGRQIGAGLIYIM